MTDFSLAKRSVHTADELSDLKFDLFISGFNKSERVQRVFADIDASRKIWLVHHEYQFEADDVPVDEESWLAQEGDSEAELWAKFIQQNIDPVVLPSLTIAIDITGMTRPAIMLAPLVFRLQNVGSLVMLYSDPHTYLSGAKTSFSTGAVEKVSQVAGLEGVHSTRYENRDVLIVGGGYDVELMKAVAEAKRSARHFMIVGLPALQSHMYQESRLQISKVQESFNRLSDDNIQFAPASDPFVAAEVTQALVNRLRSSEPNINIYLSPVGPKPHALGLAWYLLCETNLKGVSAIFPYASTYSQETSTGLARLHRYDLELELVSFTP